MTKRTIELAGYVQCRECDSALAAQIGRLVHHDDGSHTWIAHDRRPLVVDGAFITAPISFDAARAINAVISAHRDEITAALEPYGLTAADIGQPASYDRIVYRDEVPTEGD